jgi:hypothetical protein
MGPFDDDLEPIEKEKKSVRSMKLADKTNLTMLSAIESVIEITKDSALGKDFMDLAQPYVEYVAKKQHLSMNQALMLSLMMNRFYDNSINIEDLSRFLNCRPFTLLSFQKDIDELEKRHFLRRSNSDMPSYRIPHEVLNAIKDNRCYEWQCATNLRPMEFFEKVMDIFDEREDCKQSLEDTVKEIDMLIMHNQQLEFCRQLTGLNFKEEDQMLLVFYCHKYVNMHDDNVNDYDLKHVLGNHKFLHVSGELSNDFHPLLINNMLEHAYDGGFQSHDNYHLTRYAKQRLLKELNLASLTGSAWQRGVIRYNDIKEKQLFYNEDVTKEVSRLGQLLREEQYALIKDRLKERGLHSGFACLFYGAPGTGKTETVLQLARQTGRHIMTVNMSEIRNMYVGESEKNVKAIFDNYHCLVKDYNIAPILLFNEADAIFCHRLENVRHSVDQMENTLQNIILQEMENLDGILIATTNLTGNLDKAFERRFLYKIDFEKPNESSRQCIWQTKMPELDHETVAVLAKQYPLSGGQIDNIARKLTVDSILYGQQVTTLENLHDLCRQESALKNKGKQIGFNN